MKRHALDPLSLVFGLLLTGIGLLFLVGGIDAADLRGEFVWPLPVLILGAAIVAVALSSKDRSEASGAAVAAKEAPGPESPSTALERTSAAPGSDIEPTTGPGGAATPPSGTAEEPGAAPTEEKRP